MSAKLIMPNDVCVAYPDTVEGYEKNSYAEFTAFTHNVKEIKKKHKDNIEK